MKQKVIITGASTGLGLALAKHYLKKGAIVGAIARSEDLLEKLSAHYPGQVVILPCDVRDTKAMHQGAQDFMVKIGVPDIVLANAGASSGTLTQYKEDIDVFQQLMDINVVGVVKTFQPYLEQMQQSGKGSLVGIASVSGYRGLPGAGAYSASKAALINYLESLRIELQGSGLKVITVCPGFIETPMTSVNPYRMPFMMSAEDAAARIASVVENQKTFAVIPWQMAMVGYMLKKMPNWMYDKLFRNAPRKPRGCLK